MSMRILSLPRVLDVVLRTEPHGCPVCGEVDQLRDYGAYCEPCGVFRCPCCLLWRHFDDGGGDDPACNECWARRRDQRTRAAARLARGVRGNRWRRLFARRVGA